MSIQHNYEAMNQLNLSVMAELYKSQSKNKDIIDMSFDERMAILLDAETANKHTARINGIKRRAKLKQNNATVEDIKYYPDRELDKAKILSLSLCEYIESNQNIIITGATGAGKTYLACALGQKACERCIPTRYVRLPDLLLELEEAKAKGTYKKKLRGWAKTKLLIIDEWMLTDVSKGQKNDLLELLELREGTASTIYASQYMPDKWLQRMGLDPVSESIIDRVVSNAFGIRIKGESSMRTR